MADSRPRVAQEIARAAIAFQREATGIAPDSCTVLMGERTLVVTMREALSPAEKQMASTPEGAARVTEFHRQLFQASAAAFHQELQRLLGVEIRESSMEMKQPPGGFIEVFPSGVIVQVFLLTGAVAMEMWTTPTPKEDSTR